MYQLTVNANAVLNLATGQMRHVENHDYLVWLDSGNVPLPADPPPAPSQDEVDTIAAKLRPKLAALAAMTPAQVIAWRAANVTTLAQTTNVLDDVLIALSVLLRRIS